MLRVPLSTKYACPAQTSWQVAACSVLALERRGLPLARTHADAHAPLWPAISGTARAFLFHRRCDLVSP